MHYVIYPDTLFLENFLCNLLFLWFLNQTFFHTASWKRLFLAAFLTAVCNTLASLLFFRCIWVLQTGVLLPAAGLTVCCCFQLKDRRRILYLFYQIVLWLLVLGGVLQIVEQWMEVRTGTLVATAAVFAAGFGILEKIFRVYQRQNECMREVVLYWKERSCHIRGYADTGNQLTDPIRNQPVSILSEEAWKILSEDFPEPLYLPIPYRSVGTPHGMLQGIQLDYMVIIRGEESRIVEKPVIAITGQPFGGIFHYSILLHQDFC